jgi:hypothetical protein
VLPTAPAEEKSTKFAAVPRLGACPKFTFGNDSKVRAVKNGRIKKDKQDFIVAWFSGTGIKLIFTLRSDINQVTIYP